MCPLVVPAATSRGACRRTGRQWSPHPGGVGPGRGMGLPRGPSLQPWEKGRESLGMGWPLKEPWVGWASSPASLGLRLVLGDSGLGGAEPGPGADVACYAVAGLSRSPPEGGGGRACVHGLSLAPEAPGQEHVPPHRLPVGSASVCPQGRGASRCPGGHELRRRRVSGVLVQALGAGQHWGLGTEAKRPAVSVATRSVPVPRCHGSPGSRQGRLTLMFVTRKRLLEPSGRRLGTPLLARGPEVGRLLQARLSAAPRARGSQAPWPCSCLSRRGDALLPRPTSRHPNAPRYEDTGQKLLLRKRGAQRGRHRLRPNSASRCLAEPM